MVCGKYNSQTAGDKIVLRDVEALAGSASVKCRVLSRVEWFPQADVG